VYIDDILISSVTVDKNLKILRDVLLLLKNILFKLIFINVYFSVKRLNIGYIVSASGNTLSLCHTEAIRNFPESTKTVEYINVSLINKLF